MHAGRTRRAASCGAPWVWHGARPGREARQADRGRAGDKPYISVEELWRPAGVPTAALERLARADAFRSLKMSRRDAAWAIKALRDDPMPLFAAADRGGERPSPELREPAVSLPATTAGREVVEDYRSKGLSLRAHPLAFLRGDLASKSFAPCAGLKRTTAGRRLSVAGLVRRWCVFSVPPPRYRLD